MRPSKLLVVTVLASSALALVACGSTVQRDDAADDGTTDDGVDDGSADEGSGDGGTGDDGGAGREQPCTGAREAGCPYAPAECVGGTWLCPPAPECPGERPADGAPCSLVGQRCEYGDGGECDDSPTHECRGGAWKVVEDELFFRRSRLLCAA